MALISPLREMTLTTAVVPLLELLDTNPVKKLGCQNATSKEKCQPVENIRSVLNRNT
jgi:hypothetical protein